MNVKEASTKLANIFDGHPNYYVTQSFSIAKALANKKAKIKAKVDSKSAYVLDDLTVATFEQHLLGKKALGVCPVNEQNKAIFGVIDIDSYEQQKLLTKTIDLVYEYALPLVPCRTKSGGLHLYLFLRKHEDAKDVKEVLEQIIGLLALNNMFNGHVEVFPLQTTVSEKKKGHSITIPYFNAYDKESGSVAYMLSSSYEEIKVEKFISLIETKFTTLEYVKDLLSKLPMGDAPPCLQALYLSNALEESSGRNNYLYSMAVFFKAKHGVEEFAKYVREANKELLTPLEDTEVEALIIQVTEKQGFYKCKDIPCKNYCDKSVCKTREFGIGFNKGHFTGTDFGDLIRVKSADPYYIWEVRFDTSLEFAKLIFKDEDELLNQRAFIRKCVKDLNQAPFIVKENDWIVIVNQALQHNLREEVIKEETDTTETAKIKRHFLRFITQNVCASHAPYLIKISSVVFRDDNYYFLHEAFQDYLDYKKLKYDSSVLREMLKLFGCEEGILTIDKKSGEVEDIDCWVKKNDTTTNKVNDFYKDVLEEDTASIMQKAKEDLVSIKEAQSVLNTAVSQDELDDVEF